MLTDTGTGAVIRTSLAQVTAVDGARVPLLVHRPAAPRGWLVWAHGGSWQHGSARAWAPITAQLAAQSGWAVVSVDYRLAPAHRFPAAVLDMLAALDWTRQQTTDLSAVVGGDSAGGTIAALAALAYRDTGDPVPAQVLAYPPLDPDCTGPSYGADPGAFPPRADLRTAWRLWLGPDTPHHAVPATPLHAGNLAGLSPVALIVGDEDPVRDDATAYADRLRADGVPRSLRVLPGVGHADLLNPAGRVLPAVTAALSTLTTDSRTTPPTKRPVS
ncbi:hypothetical protein Vqi01_09980 [Micromonospora qiuiae]|uniref:Alpha/beta hydrolase fold-3 domain-containing protein n=1 Tax=Micromonospora qiuiae TaxID=502268 RepID=A0ABQ4J736_9ACTN|nr:alpha/beta hydrolase [Micromonospora qiuiae]GIJ25836.1 hypothetical protein Vqi01_09980 [Micromonospora qiuiae]